MRRNNKHINKQRGTWVDINGFTTAQLGHWLHLMKAPNQGISKGEKINALFD